MCVCVCVYVCMYVCVYVVCVCVCMCCMYACMHVCMYVCMYLRRLETDLRDRPKRGRELRFATLQIHNHHVLCME